MSPNLPETKANCFAVSWIVLLILGGAAVAWTVLRPANESEVALKPQRHLLLVEIALPGDSPTPVAEWAANSLAQELGLQVLVQERPLFVSKKSFHPERGQGNAVELVERIEQMVRQDCAVLGLTQYDLHSPLRKDLPFAMGARKGWAGLISTYRMEDKRHPENTKLRLKKMLIRYAAEIACDAKRDHDPQSVLYESLHRPEQLDIMLWPD